MEEDCGERLWRGKWKSLVGNREMKLNELPETEGARRSALQPYGPPGPKRIGEVICPATATTRYIK